MRKLAPALVVLALSLMPARADDPACNWSMYGQDLGHSFSQACTEITPANVSTLRPKWFIPSDVPISASAAVVDGVVYIGDWDGKFFALDADDGSSVWSAPFQVDDPSKVFGVIESSAAVADVGPERIVAFGGGSTLYVLDAADGSELARACLDPRATTTPCASAGSDIGIESSPSIVTVGSETWIVVGHGVHNNDDKGRTGVVALRYTAGDPTLDPVWKFDPETEKTYRTSCPTGSSAWCVATANPLTYDGASGYGCAGVWSSPAVDPSGGRVFFGTANCSTLSLGGETGGEAMWSVDLVSGQKAWSFSPRGPNLLDDDFGASANLLPGGLVGEGGKDGVYYARDRATGAEAWTSHAAQSGHLSTGFAFGGFIGTTAVGAVNGAPAVIGASALSTPIGGPFDGDDPGFDEDLFNDPGRMLSLHAIDAATGDVLWRSVTRQAFGAVTYAASPDVAGVGLGGVVFVPSTFSASVVAVDANTGAPLWTGQLNGAPSSAPVVAGDSIYLGTGTTVDPIPLGQASGIWAFQLAQSVVQ